MQPSAPAHYWFVTLVAVIWAAFGAIDYCMTQYGSAWYLGHFGEAQIAYYTSMPALAQGGWGIAVWSVVLGAILLLIRESKAVFLFALAFAGYFVAVLSLAYQTTPSFYEVSGLIGAAILWGSVAINLGLWLITRGYRKSKVID